MGRALCIAEPPRCAHSLLLLLTAGDEHCTLRQEDLMPGRTFSTLCCCCCCASFACHLSAHPHAFLTPSTGWAHPHTPTSYRCCCWSCRRCRRDSYLMGVQALARSLQAVHSRHPLVVIFTSDTLTRGAVQALEAEGCRMVAVERYAPHGHGDGAGYKLALYAECWCKLQMWQLEEYARC